MFMTGKLAQCPKAFEMKTDGGNVQFRPVKTGHGDKFAPKDLLILRSEQGHFTLAYTPFCPLHATNVHSAAQCKQWQKKLQFQKDAKAQVQRHRSDRTERRADHNDQASTSRANERNAY